MDIKQFNGVRLKDGREAAVLDLYEDGTVFLVEICDEYGRTLDTPFVKKEDITEITYHAPL